MRHARQIEPPTAAMRRQMHAVPPPEHPAPAGERRAPFPSGRAWTLLLVQICLVVGIELGDDTIRGFLAPRPIAPTQANAVAVMRFEQAHGFWIEPGLQRSFQQPHHLLGLTITWPRVVPVVNTLYGVAHGVVTLLVVLWLFLRRRELFAFVRDVFLFTTALSVLLYNLYPVAPPRLATGLTYEGRPFHFVDTIFKGGGVDLSFDKYAAMPSLHVAWALIAGLTLAWAARAPIVRLFGLVYPLLMTVAVIITGNHYIADCLGAAGVVLVAYALAWLVVRLQARRSGRARRGAHLPSLLARAACVRSVGPAASDAPVRQRPAHEHEDHVEPEGQPVQPAG